MRDEFVNQGAPAGKGTVIQDLLEYARQIERYRSGGTAVEIRLSTIRGRVTEGNVLFAINMFRSMVDQNEGRLFILDNSDLIFVYRGLRKQDVRSAVEKLRLLYSEQLLNNEEAKAGRGFIIWYDLVDEAEAFRRAVERRAGAEAPTQQQPVSAIRPPAAAPEPTQFTSSATALSALAASVGVLERIKIRALLRRQSIFHIPMGGNATPRFQELYISIPDLEVALGPGTRLTEDRWLFQYFTQLLDRRMMLYLRDSDDPELSSGFSLNVNVASLLSPEFGPFSNVLSDAQRPTVVFEFQMADVFSDLGSYFYVRDMARERRFRICLDGVTDLSLPLVDAPRLGLDFLKVRWHADLPEANFEQWRRDLAWPALHDSCEVILCRVDSKQAVDFGHSGGIELFQGRYLDPPAQS
jgi:hypothetical protein